MSLKENKGAISIFVLVALLFIAAFLIISYANNVNKSKVIRDQFNIINDIYTGSENDESAYEKVYSALRSNNQRTLTSYSEKSSTLEITRSLEGSLSNYKIYGNAGGVGNETKGNVENAYEITIKIGTQSDETKTIFLNKPLESGDYIDYKEQKVFRADGTQLYHQE